MNPSLVPLTEETGLRIATALEELVALMRQDAEPEVPVVLGEFLPKGSRRA